MKKLFTLIALIGFVMLAGCTQPEEPVLTPILTDCTIGAEGGEMTISVATNQTLQVTSDASWLTVPNATKAVNTETVKAIAEANPTTKHRTAKLNITAGDLKATVKVTQAGLKPVIDVNAASFFVGAEGGDITMDVTSNVDYKVAVNVGWITRNGNTFTVASNDSESDRTGSVTFSYGSLSNVVTVKQKGKTPDPYMEITPTLKSVGPKGDTFDVLVSTNQGTPKGESSAEWVTVSGTSVTVAENPEPELRSAVVIFTAGGMSKILNISQAPKSVLDNAGASTFTVPAAGDDINITVRSNVEYTVSVGDCDWIIQTKAGSVNEYQHVFHVAANDDTAARTAAISFTYDASLTFSVSVAQEAFVPVIKPDSASVEAETEGGSKSVAVEANCVYEAACEAEWISITGQGETLAFEVAPNSDPEERHAEILLSYKGVVISSLNVIQAAAKKEPTNLSANGTANTYIVDVDNVNPEGYYFTTTVAGNGISMAQDFEYFAYTGISEVYPVGGKAELLASQGVEVLWNQNNCISDVAFDVESQTISFKATGVKGNAKVSAICNGVKHWTWLIWCTDQPGTIEFTNENNGCTLTVMDRNIGATTNTGSTDLDAMDGVRYQFGNPIPWSRDEFAVASFGNNNLTMQGGLWQPTVPNGMAAWAVQWFFPNGSHGKQLYGILWGGGSLGAQQGNLDEKYHINYSKNVSVKTLYDPCPVGYKIAPYCFLAGYGQVGEAQNLSADVYGIHLAGDNGGDVLLPYNGMGWFGGNGLMSWAQAGVFDPVLDNAVYLYLWTSAFNNTNVPYALCASANCATEINVTNGSLIVEDAISHAMGIRCVAE